MNIKIIVSTVVILAIVGGIILFKIENGSRGSYSDSYSNSSVSVPSTTALGTSTLYTLADVAKHPNATSCWTAVRGQVYDMTSWIERHPGGERAILDMCGKDGTNDFIEQHGGQGRPERELVKYVIGTLAK